MIYLLCNPASKTPVRLNRGPHYLLGGVGIRALQSTRIATVIGIPYCVSSVFFAYKYRNLFPILSFLSFALTLRLPKFP